MVAAAYVGVGSGGKAPADEGEGGGALRRPSAGLLWHAPCVSRADTPQQLLPVSHVGGQRHVGLLPFRLLTLRPLPALALACPSSPPPPHLPPCRRALTPPGTLYKEKQAMTIQYHPEASPGPHDAGACLLQTGRR